MNKKRLHLDFFETCNKWPKWQDVPVNIKILFPRGCQPLPRGYIRYEKNVYKIRLQIDVFEACSKWLKWQEVSVHIKILSPGGCPPLSCGYIHLLNLEKKSMKSEVEQMTKVMRPSCWYQNTCPNGLCAPAQGLYGCRKSWKSVHKIRGHS